MFNKELLICSKGGIEKLTTAGGRKLYRHESDMGTVIEFNDGQDRKVLVLDAQYRGKRMRMADEDTDTSLPNYTNNKNINNTLYINGSNSKTSPAECSSLTDNILNSLWVNTIDANTSKYNTDVWITQPYCECATHCRSIKVNGIGCDIPNIQTLMRIFCEAVLLDELDPTVSSYPDFKLTNWFSGWYLFSSTEHGDGRIFEVGHDGGIYCTGTDYEDCVCPVLEL